MKPLTHLIEAKEYVANISYKYNQRFSTKNLVVK